MTKRLSQQTAKIIYLTYSAAQSINAYMDAILYDPDEPPGLKNWAKQTQNRARWVIGDIETRTDPTQVEQFREEIKKCDHVVFDEIRDLMTRMSPEKQAALEDCARAILEGNFELIKSDE